MYVGMDGRGGGTEGLKGKKVGRGVQKGVKGGWGRVSPPARCPGVAWTGPCRSRSLLAPPPLPPVSCISPSGTGSPVTTVSLYIYQSISCLTSVYPPHCLYIYTSISLLYIRSNCLSISILCYPSIYLYLSTLLSILFLNLSTRIYCQSMYFRINYIIVIIIYIFTAYLFIYCFFLSVHKSIFIK